LSLLLAELFCFTPVLDLPGAQLVEAFRSRR